MRPDSILLARALVEQRGLDVSLIEEVRWTGDDALLSQLEQLTPSQVEEVNTAWRNRLRLTCDLDAVTIPLPWCNRLCCPVAGQHDRRHPLCVVMPGLWEGDQA